MTDWRRVGDLVSFSGKGITPKYVEKSSIIVLNQKCIRNNRIDYSFSRFTNDEKSISETKFIQIGDILFNSTGQGTAGRCAFVKDLPSENRVVVDSHILIVRIPDYNEALCLCSELHSKESLIQSFMDGSTGQGELDKIRVFNLLTSLTSDQDLQKIISSLIIDLDQKIDINNQINNELESIAKLIYDYWFVQFDFPISAEQAKAMSKPKLEGRPYKSSGGKMEWSDELKREIPERWGVGSLSDLFQINPKESLSKNTEAQYIGMTSVPARGYMTEIPKRKPFGGGMKFRNNDVVVARITPCLENGKTALITLLDDNQIGFGSTEFIVLRGKERDLSSFASILARSDTFRKYAISKMTGTSGRKRLNGDSAGLFKLAIPTASLLDDFEYVIKPFFDKMTSNAKENQELSSLRDWLLPMLMNGQVRMGE